VKNPGARTQHGIAVYLALASFTATILLCIVFVVFRNDGVQSMLRIPTYVNLACAAVLFEFSVHKRSTSRRISLMLLINLVLTFVLLLHSGGLI